MTYLKRALRTSPACEKLESLSFVDSFYDFSPAGKKLEKKNRENKVKLKMKKKTK